MCIMSENPVGCDVEQISMPDIKIAKRFFSEPEIAKIVSYAGEKEQADCFFRFWTLKESFIKCVGQGLSVPLNEFTILLDREVAGIMQSIDDGFYSLGECNLDGGYKYAWCRRDPENASNAMTAPSLEEIEWKRQ